MLYNFLFPQQLIFGVLVEPGRQGTGNSSTSSLVPGIVLKSLTTERSK